MDTPIDCETPGLAPEVRAALCDPLISYVAKRFGYPFSPDSRPDIYDQVRVNLVSAARTWDSTRSKFITHATVAIKHALKSGGERRGKQRPEAENAWQKVRHQVLEGKAAAEAVDAADSIRWMRSGLDKLDEASRDTLLGWLEHGQNASAAGRAAGLGRNTMRNRVNRALERLKRLLGDSP